MSASMPARCRAGANSSTAPVIQKGGRGGEAGRRGGGGGGGGGGAFGGGGAASAERRAAPCSAERARAARSGCPQLTRRCRNSPPRGGGVGPSHGNTTSGLAQQEEQEGADHWHGHGVAGEVA
ncbi:unnamed protein product [Prorocentrum cordatum]|uniref:Uncharacterized protein n=1 Tax=Prorocentrum cordatum TaxID=2364126 RepID=A0ABN9VK92_9DINO|nr:unnamed protein product [Polarella glacialis]